MNYAIKDFQNTQKILSFWKQQMKEEKQIIKWYRSLNKKDLTIEEALLLSRVLGISFIKNSWSDEAKQNLQYYVGNRDKKTIFIQRKDNKPEKQQPPTGTSFAIYEGPYKKYRDLMSKELQELEELEIKVGPLYEDFKKYEKLKEMLDYLE